MILLRLFGLASAGYGLILLLMFFGQSSLLHLPHVPGRSLMATPEQIGLHYEDVFFTAADGTRLHGWYLPAATPGPTLLFFHGNAGNISHRLESLRIFHQLGLNVFIFDYRGYGQSEGRPSEAGLNADADAALRYLERERGLSATGIIAFGRSLGGALAACLAAREPLGGLILESSFISVPELAAELYPWLPARRLARLQYDTLSCLQQDSGRTPVLVVHSPDDEIVPFRHGQVLAAAAGAELLELRGDHNRGFLLTGTAYRRGLARFLAQLAEPGAATEGPAAEAGQPSP